MVRGCLKLRINLSSAVSLIMNSIISFISFFLGGGAVAGGITIARN